MWKLWNLADGNGNPDGWQVMRDPVVRRQMAEVILQARDKDALAIEAIERTLAAWS